jgi:hypothetical protein
MDMYNIPSCYTINPTPEHYIDLNETDRYQKEVYTFTQKFMEVNRLRSVIDVGCGSGYKLVRYLGAFTTTGIETEPCISFLRRTYPDRIWIDSGEPEKSFSSIDLSADVVICSDVIEHIIDPDNLLKFLLTINAKYYILSTPCREILFKRFGHREYGPPSNRCHVREWTMDEFKGYLSSSFIILGSYYATNQAECQYHLLQKR